MDIYHALFWACATLCAIAELLILRAALRPAPPAPSTVPQSPRGVEILWGILPAFALIAILWAAWRALI